MEIVSDAAALERNSSQDDNEPTQNLNTSEPSHDSQTATEFINSQLQLEADAREALPYAFDRCTNPLGPLRQNLFSCLTCNPPPTSPSEQYTAAGFCYSCSIACHGEHTLVELFDRRNFTCDCGTTRLPSGSPCTLRINPATGIKGPVHSQTAANSNSYNKNFQNRFCGCGEVYNAHEEKGTMFQCLGLASEQDGGCGEDWWHPECVLGLGRGWAAGTKPELNPSTPPRDISPNVDRESSADTQPLSPGFPQEEEFEAFICYKCVEANPWIKAYAGTVGFLKPVFKGTSSHQTNTPPNEKMDLRSTDTLAAQAQLVGERILSEPREDAKRITPAQPFESSNKISQNYEQTLLLSNEDSNAAGDPSHQTDLQQPTENRSAAPLKRKAEDSSSDLDGCSDSKKAKTGSDPAPYHESLLPAPSEPFSLFCKEDFRDHFCRCASCYLNLRKQPQLLEEEESYEPPLSESGEEAGQSVGTGSLLDRGEAALSNVDRVRAIEGVMAYNHLKDKVKTFLQPFAESGQVVGAEDIKAYFEKLRGDDQAIKAAGGKIIAGGGDDGPDSGNRREQSGY